MRRLIAFPCHGATLFGTLDAAAGNTGLLIVAGGNEVRVGTHRGMALLAERLAAAGVPVFRYDRRGIGDSDGENDGFRSGGPDMAAAATAFRAAMPQLTTLVGLGNCDAASALALFGRAAGIDRVVLTNPWLIASTDALPPAAAIRARYRERLLQPATWWRLLRGGVDLRKALAGLRKLLRADANGGGDAIVAAIASWGADARVILAEGDATALAFADAAPHIAVIRIPSASHSFAGEAGRTLEAEVRRALG